MCNRKAIKISPNQHAGLPSMLYRGSFENSKKGVKLVSRSLFIEFFIKKLFCNVALTGQISLPDCV